MTESSFEETLDDGTVIGDHFVIRSRLGGGGMGDVYLAENQEFPDKKYAIKLLKREFSASPHFASMLRDEAAKQARLEHDNVVGMYDFVRWSGHYCLIQTYVAGRTLARMIEEAPGGLPLATALPLMSGILKGLDYAHEHGILHCDVKPANVIVDAEGRPRVTDFGISRDIGAGDGNSGVVGAGTPDYMSPEQVLRPREIDHRSDVYSAGVLFFEMLSGRLPFDGAASQGAAVLPQVHTDAPDIRSVRADIPEGLARIVATALQRDPARRFQGCGDFDQALSDHVRRERWRRTWLPALAGTAVVVVLGSIGLYQWLLSVKAESDRRARQAAGEALVNAASAANLLCREWIEYQAKQTGMEKARASNMPDLVLKFEVRLRNMQLNLDKHAASYADALQLLRRIDAAIVSEVLAARAAADPMIRPVAGSLGTDAAALRRGEPVPGKDALIARCPDAAGAAPAR